MPLLVNVSWKVSVEGSSVAVPVAVAVPLAPANRPVPPVIVSWVVNAKVVAVMGKLVLVDETVRVSPLADTIVVVYDDVLGPVNAPTEWEVL